MKIFVVLSSRLLLLWYKVVNSVRSSDFIIYIYIYAPLEDLNPPKVPPFLFDSDHAR
jgi:hypothetical protein